MATRTEIKRDAVARAQELRATKRARRAELKAMAPHERRAAKAADKRAARQARKDATAERKEARAGMTRAERREDKRRARIDRKVEHRPRRAVGWGVTAVAVIAIGGLVAPFASAFGRLMTIEYDSSTEAGVAARENAAQVSEDISDEGIVLLKNQDDLLPLADANLNVFSFASFNLILGGGGSGGSNQSQSVTFYDALAEQGITVNPELKATLEEAGAKTSTGNSNGLLQIASSMLKPAEGEPAPDYLTDDVMAQAAQFSGTALVVIGNDGVEGSDMSPEQLRLTDEQRELFDVVTASFDDVVVVVNSGNQMELGFLDEYPQIRSAVWIGTPGPRGAVSLAKVLTGDVNPSGRLTDTYAYDVTSAPAVANVGDFDYANAKRSYMDYEESIYVGYRYYETRYAGDEAGYAQAVQFPFGHGLSYTTFAHEATAPRVEGDTISVDVTVTNTGGTAGKDVVQVYFSAPWTPGGIEKSAIELAGYDKTATLQPGESETVTVTFDVRDMASWDTEGHGAYLLEAGTYQVSVRTDVHTPVAQFDHTVAEDVVYATDADTGAELTNRFDYVEGDLTYLSRADWEGTYPQAPEAGATASDELLARMDPEIEPAEGQTPTYGADNGLVLADLAGLDHDDPQWEEFLDQLTLDEQVDLFAKGAYRTHAVDRLGIPAMDLLDGPAGLNSLFSSLEAAAYPTQIVVASTWNDDLARALGESVGTEANAYGIEGWYAPGMNLHRTALGGRDFEYFSEDPHLSGKMSAAMVSGAESKGVLTFMKHFALNEQEVNARSGVNVFVDEQALRELYLKPFEITVKEADPTGAMSSFINMGGVWAGANEQLLQDVLRGEWGFEGVVSTDAVLGAWMDPGLAARYGNDLMLAMLPGSDKATKAAVDEDPVGVGNALRDRVHTVLYTTLQTNLFD